MKFIVFLGALWLLLAGRAGAQTNFFQGKTVTLIVGSGAGTAYDMYARLLGSYIGKHL